MPQSWIRRATVVACAFALGAPRVALGQLNWSFILPEDRKICVRDPSQLPKARIPDLPTPQTVDAENFDGTPRPLSLDEALRIALQNSEVVRVLSGVQAVSSGLTIYDPSISATAIEQEKGRFDPTVQALNSFNRFETPQAVFDPGDPNRAIITGSRTDDYNLGLDVSKDTVLGGTANLGVNTNPTRRRPGIFPLNPFDRSAVEFSYTQPLLQGGGIAANVAPIVLARIDTERSYFRYKDSMQSMVNGVVEAYWALVQARLDLWARQQQVDQAKFAFERAQAQFRAELADINEVSQTELAYANFRVALTAARANVLLTEAALRNILGLPPADGLQLIPVTPPTLQEIQLDWQALVQVAEQRRPDLIELKLILEADQQLLIQSNNNALPRVDAVGLYRWNGLEGEMPIGDRISTDDGQFTDWTLGVNFSVPLGLRSARAQLRRQELVIARDRANLDQGLHSVVHELTINIRNLAQFYQQYEGAKQARVAAQRNLDLQFREYEAGRVIFLNVLQAITDWGNAISAEAASLLQYNNELARLERATGTILETHGIRFYEERFCSIGPLGRLGPGRAYPESNPPGPNAERYPVGDEPSEDTFDLEPPYAKAGAATGSSTDGIATPPPEPRPNLPPPIETPPLFDAPGN